MSGERESRPERSGPPPRTVKVNSRSPHPIFDALIMEAMSTRPEDTLSHEDVARELGITEAERAVARAEIATWEPDGPEEDEDAGTRSAQTEASAAPTRQS